MLKRDERLIKQHTRIYDSVTKRQDKDLLGNTNASETTNVVTSKLRIPGRPSGGPRGSGEGKQWLDPARRPLTPR